ncbi:GPX7-like protein [Mya arenaria]|uniref:Glutathione peroxidase n=1 Tax=Mya arenaria TaxID=6604 RepID=A0ABY7FP47_MYAAR|nr:glutathione peroxidase 7-like [Mya arenaria]WAR22914.1 GPX7-like protein [Mya arenaria]
MAASMVPTNYIFWFTVILNLLLIIMCLKGVVGNFDADAVDPDHANPDDGSKHEKTFYSFSVQDATGDIVELKKYMGMVTLVVNVASECGFTDNHYRGLVRLKNTLSTENKFEVLAFPCNQFGRQEPGANSEIQEFVKGIYNVNFPVFGKIDVLGNDVTEPWRYLIESYGRAPNWNFWKYLVDEEGHVVNAWSPHTSVEDIFHEVKEAIDFIGHDKPNYHRHWEL